MEVESIITAPACLVEIFMMTVSAYEVVTHYYLAVMFYFSDLARSFWSFNYL